MAENEDPKIILEKLHDNLDAENQEIERQIAEIGDTRMEEAVDDNGDNLQVDPTLTSEEVIKELKGIIQKQNAFIKVIMEPPLHAADIVEVLENGNVIVSFDDAVIEASVNPTIKNLMMPALQVFLDKPSMTVVKLATKPFHPGALGTVERVLDFGYAEVECQGKIVKVFNPVAAKRGDSVTLDGSGLTITEIVPKDKSRFKLNTLSKLTWADIGGLEEAKKEMISAIDWPYRHKELFQKYGRKPVKGVALWGPPGCGKTMIAKVAANVLAELHDKESVATGYIYVKGPEILSPWVGKAEATVRQLFLHAKEHKARYGYPALIFIDEAESILAKRGTGISSDMEKTIVPMFLSEMDGLEDSSALVMLATNRIDVMDPAILRDGRIDIKIKIPRPDKSACLEIFNIHLQGTAYGKELPGDLAVHGVDELFGEKRNLYWIVLKNGERKPFGMDKLVTGAMIHGIIQNGITHAIERDLKRGCLSGLSSTDITAGVDKTFKQLRQSKAVLSDVKASAKKFGNDLDTIEVAE